MVVVSSSAAESSSSSGTEMCPISYVAETPPASPHTPACSVLTWSTNPPTAGPHYGVWAAFRNYQTPVPRGFYVHAMEHGAVVLLYNCPDGCAEDVAAMEAFLDARPADPLCVPPLKNRFVLTPDPLLPTRFAAAAWGYAITMECLNLPAMGLFIDARYGAAPENFCFDGVDPTAPDAGYPENCGQ